MVVRQLHHFHERFDSVITLRAKLIEELKKHVPDSVTFNVGYFEGQQHSKVWLVSCDDLDAMYAKYPRGQITLWCDSRIERSREESVSAKRKRDETNTRRQEKEDEVDEVYLNLKSKHADKYSTPKMRLWARMITSNLHDDLDNPPNIPAFCGATTPRRSYQPESFSNAISGAAVAIVKALAPTANTPKQVPTVTGVSPSKSVELRMKNFKQLRYLQQLFDDGVLTEEEYAEQKQSILSALRKL